MWQLTGSKPVIAHTDYIGVSANSKCILLNSLFYLKTVPPAFAIQSFSISYFTFALFWTIILFPPKVWNSKVKLYSKENAFNYTCFFLPFSVRQTSTFQMHHLITLNRFVEEIKVPQFIRQPKTPHEVVWARPGRSTRISCYHN